ncbi:MAG: phospholipid carrier-dependent glycosyltransferase [Chloroflexaceae bacterium]|nr:phospholipid carrier-dependent glycosyltransferase [Chloroflexaceae bacterium]
MTNRWYTLLLTLTVVLAMLPRLWLWADQGRAGVVPPGDEDEYYRGAIHLLLEGSYYDDGQWLRPPVTSLFLAGVFALAGEVNLPLAMLVQCVVSAATVVLLAETARRLFLSRRAGGVAALLAALFLPYASHASQLLSETLHVFLVAAALLLFEVARHHRMSRRYLLAGGAAWGLAALTRPVGVYAVPLLLVWAWWAGRGQGQRQLAASASRPLALLLGFVLVVAPWTIRNAAVYHHLVLVDTNGGVSFWLGNLREPVERDWQAVWNRTIPNSAERQQVATARALDNIRHEPLTFLARMRYKTVSLWQLDTRQFVANAPIGVTIDERSLAFAVASDIQYVAVMVLALGGVVLARPSEHNLALLGWPLYGTLLSAVSLGHPRLRLPLLVVMFVYAALVLAHPRRAWERLRGASWRRLVALIVGMVFLAFLFYAQAYLPFARSQLFLALAHLGGGEAAITQAIAASPHHYLPYVALGEWQRQRGKLPEALQAYNQAASHAPQNTYVHLQRLDLFRRLGNPEGAQEAMAAIAAVGWDTNQVYTWAWERLPDPNVTSIQLEAPDITDPAPGLMRGVYAVEYDGEQAFRWTMGRAQMRLGLLAPEPPGQPGQPVPSSRLRLRLRADHPDTPVEVFYQYRDLATTGYEPLATLRVGPSWEDVTIPLGGRGIFRDNPFGSTGVVDLRTPTHVASTAEPYPRGVALAGVWLEYDE